MVPNIKTGNQASALRDRSPGRLIRNSRGFTLIELMIVVSIIGILAAIAVPNYQWSIIKAREAVLRENLYNFRTTIDQFYADNGKFPDSLAELADKKYLREVPRDPFTGKNDTWVVAPPPPEVLSAPSGVSGSQPTSGGTPFTGGGGPLTTGSSGPGNVYDVHSGSNLVGTNGTPYNEW